VPDPPPFIYASTLDRRHRRWTRRRSRWRAAALSALIVLAAAVVLGGL